MVTATPALAALTAGAVLFVAALIWTRYRTPRDAADRAAPRSRRSLAGIWVQVAAFLVCCAGAPRVALAPLSPLALTLAAAVLVLWVGSVAVFLAATRAMGRNWSIVARTRSDHRLVEFGPFARARHPIYSAIGLQLIGCALALSHLDRLVVALPLYAIGTWLRISEEERMLRAMFGPAYDAYAARVRRFVPGLF